MRGPIQMLGLVALATWTGCDSPGPAPAPPPAVVAPARQMEPAFTGVIQFEWLGEGAPAPKVVEIGPGKVTGEYVQVKPDEGMTDVVFEYRFLHHEEGADHYRFGAYVGEAGFSGAAVGQDVAFSGKPVVVFDEPESKYKVQILPPAEADSGSPSADGSR